MYFHYELCAVMRLSVLYFIHVIHELCALFFCTLYLFMSLLYFMCELYCPLYHLYEISVFLLWTLCCNDALCTLLHSWALCSIFLYPLFIYEPSLFSWLKLTLYSIFSVLYTSSIIHISSVSCVSFIVPSVICTNSVYFHYKLCAVMFSVLWPLFHSWTLWTLYSIHSLCILNLLHRIF